MPLGGRIGCRMALASCSQARSFSPTHAAITAKMFDHGLAIDCIFFHWKKLDRAPAFAQVPPLSGRDRHRSNPARTSAGPIIWLSLDDFLLLRARSGKSQLRFVLVVCHARDNAFQKRTIETNLIVDAKLALRRSRVKASVAAAASRSASAHSQPRRGDHATSQRDLSPEWTSIALMQWPGISFLNPVPRHARSSFRSNIVGLDSQYASQRRFLLQHSGRNAA